MRGERTTSYVLYLSHRELRIIAACLAVRGPGTANEVTGGGTLYQSIEVLLRDAVPDTD